MEAIYPGHLWNTPWWGDPPVLGHYPEEGLRVYGSAVPKFKSSDMDIDLPAARFLRLQHLPRREGQGRTRGT